MIKRVLDKINSLIINGIRREHAFIIAIGYSTIITLIMGTAGFIRWEGSDEFTISQLFMGTGGEATPYSITSSYYFGIVVVWLQQKLPIINWLTGLEVLSIWASFGIMEWFLIKHSKEKNISFALIMPLLFEPLFLLNLHYTRVACLLSFSGLLLLYMATFGGRLIVDTSEEFKASCVRRITIFGSVQAVIGVLLFVFGTLFRYACMYISLAYIAILLFTYIFIAKKEHCLKDYMASVVGFMIVTGISVGIALFIYNQNQKVYEEWDQTNNYRAYNKTRSNVTDYMPSEYYDDLSTSQLKISENDYYMLKCAVINDDVFSLEYLEAVRDNMDIVEENDTLKERLNNVRQVAYYRTGKLTGYRTWLFVCTIILLSTVLLGNKKNWLAIGVDILGTIVLIVYFLAGGRLPSWIVDSVYFFASYIAILETCCFVDFELKEKCGYRIRKYIFVMILMVCICVQYDAVRDNVKKSWFSEDLKEAIRYAEESKDIFLLDNISECPYPYIDVYGAMAFFEEGQWDNIIRVGNWDVEHPARNAQKETLGIDSVIYSLVEGKSRLISIENSYSFKMYEAFFKEHYDVNIKFECEKHFGNYGIYKALLV